MKKYLESVAMVAVIGWAVLFAAVATRAEQEDPQDLSANAITNIPVVTLDKYRPIAILLDWRGQRGVITWEKGFIVADEFVPRMVDSYTFTNVKGGAQEWTALRTAPELAPLLARFKTFLVAKDEL